MPKIRFTVRELKALPVPEKGRKEYHDIECPSLTVIITQAGTLTFHRYGRIDGDPCRIRIGPFPDWSIEAARERCRILTGEIAQGKNPQKEKRAKLQEKTLKEAWEWYLEHEAKPHKKTWEREVSQWDRTLADWGSLRLSQISRTMLVERRDALSVDGPGAGRKFIDLARAIFRQCVDNEWCPKNPAAGVTITRPEERDRFILPDEMKRFFAAVFKLRDVKSQHFILLALFLQARRSNICSMEWTEIDWDREVWTIPKPKAKGKKTKSKPIILPIPRLAMDVLHERRGIAKRDDRWVFPSSQSPTGHYTEPKAAWKSVLTKSGLTDLKVHDLRRTGASFQAIAGVSLQIIAKSLGHASTRATEIYARLNTDPVRIAMESASQQIWEHSEQEKK
jgi:integrase